MVYALYCFVVMTNTNPRSFDPTVASDYEDTELVSDGDIDEVPDYVLVRIAISIARTHGEVEGSKVVHIPAE